MKQLTLLVISILVSVTLAAQLDSFTLKHTAQDLNAALLNQDSAKLNQLLHKKCSYGHSNNWIEKKPELIANLFNGTLQYKRIEQGPMTAIIEDKTGLIRSDVEVEVALKGKTSVFRLHVLQVWIWKNKKGWILLGRQAVRIAD